MEPKEIRDAKLLSTSAIESKKQWRKASYKLGLKRSPALQDIDSAVSAYRQAMQTAATSYSRRVQLSDDLLAKITTWEGTKLTKTGPKTDRQLAVDQLKQHTQEEQRRLRQYAAAELSQVQKAATYNPSEVFVYSAGILLDNTGAFVGDTADDYEACRAELPEGASEMDIRLALLKTKLRTAYKHFQKHNKSQAESLGLFTAPEWFFKRPNAPFTRKEKRYLTKKIKKLSKSYPGMLLVPGSTVWAKGSGDNLELRATASAYFNGERVHQTHKRGMAFDECSYDPETMSAAWERAQQTNRDSSLFLLGSRLLALDICGDHGRASKEHYQKYGQEVGSDIHILVSKGMGFSRGQVALRDGGIGVSNDASVHSSDKGGLRSVFWEGSRVPNPGYYPGSSAAPFLYGGEFQKHQVSTTQELKELFMGRYDLPS